jgi:hypothetical protein
MSVAHPVGSNGSMSSARAQIETNRRPPESTSAMSRSKRGDGRRGMRARIRDGKPCRAEKHSTCYGIFAKIRTMSFIEEKNHRTKIKNWMMNNAHHHDNATSLAEDAAHNAMTEDHDEWLDDEHHWIWDVAIEVLPTT